jgi:hypothetical protein
MEQFDVYNLEFRYGIESFTIASCKFSRAPNHREQVKKLSHRVHSHGELGEIVRQGGTHAKTAILEAPEKRDKAALDHGNDDADMLQDLMLLLSLFSGRDVFFDKLGEPSIVELVADPREHFWGGVLICSLPVEILRIPDKDEPFDPTLGQADVAFEREMTKLYKTIGDSVWQRRYRRGHFLIQARNAFRAQPVESTFIQCWAIWEHLFALHTDSWLSESSIRNLPAIEKITFILVQYGFSENVDGQTRKQIQKLIETRNRLIHVGRLPTNADENQVILFVRLTEFVIAKILGLKPSNLFNTIEQLERFNDPKANSDT